jgi:hypothetical protein
MRSAHRNAGRFLAQSPLHPRPTSAPARYKFNTAPQSNDATPGWAEAAGDELLAAIMEQVIQTDEYRELVDNVDHPTKPGLRNVKDSLYRRSTVRCRAG